MHKRTSIQRIFWLEVIILICLFFVFFSCKKPDISHSDSLSISKTTLSIDTAVGTIDSFNVQSTVQWTASLSPGADWLQINKNSGAAGNTPIKITIVSNNRNVPVQTATIKISATNNNDIPPVTLTVTKKTVALGVDYHIELGGTKDETAIRSMAKTSDGGIILVGGASSSDGDVHGNNGDVDMWIVKLNNRGDTIWTKTYGGSAEDGGASVVATSDGGYVVCGSTSSTNGDIHHSRGGFDAWLLKLNANGDTLWTKTYGGTSNERANAIITTADDGFAITGYTQSNNGDISHNHGSGDVWFLKLNSVGDTLWTRTYGGSSWDEAESIIATTDGGYALAGLTNSNDQDVTGFHVSSFVTFDMWIVKLDAAGNKLWAGCLGGTLNDVALSTAATAGGFVVTGYTNSVDGDVPGNHGNAAFFSDMWVIKFSNNGSIVWSKNYGGTFDDYGLSIIATSDGGYAIAGATNSNDGDVTGNHVGPGDDIWIVKLDKDGGRQWSKALGGINDDVGGAILQVSDGYIISGFTDSNDGDFSGSGYHGNYDMYVMKIFVR